MTGSGSPAVVTRLNYIGPMAHRPRYHVVNTSRDVITRDRRTVRIRDARLRAQTPSLAREGFELLRHESAVLNFSDQEELARIYPGEIERLVMELSGADHVAIHGRGVLRFNEPKLPCSSHFDMLRPARFIHMDVSDCSAAALQRRWQPREIGRPVRRCAHYNVWRVLSPPPQDIPLAVCDSLSVSPSELIDADAVADIPGAPEATTVVVLVRYSPRHRWWYFPNMLRDEVLIFKSYDSDPDQPRHVPHSAFKNPACPQGIASRVSIEMRAIAFWV